jgi:hypothetical protein
MRIIIMCEHHTLHVWKCQVVFQGNARESWRLWARAVREGSD